MKQDIKDLWIQALLSGEYPQGEGQLFDGDNYCCLGVLCDLHRKLTNKGFWDEGTYASFDDDFEGNDDVLPKFVQEWAELYSSDPAVESGLGESLADMNDHGVEFPEIAKIIQKQL